jgi:2-polyprenyl-6-methoxyphenol hydroxylase-like FAD-dependent oxidoreductase
MGGLATAGALTENFEPVTVVERDALPSASAHRPGTPQARHVHGLLVSGLRGLCALFPGFDLDLERAGAVPLRVGVDIRVERPGYDPFPQRDLGWLSYAVSRPTLEYAVGRRVENLANTTVRQGCRASES